MLASKIPSTDIPPNQNYWSAWMLSMILVGALGWNMESPVWGQSEVDNADKQGEEPADSVADESNSDGFPAGSVWNGLLTQKGKHPELKWLPARYEATLVVSSRDENRFTGRLYERTGGIRVTYRVEGDVVDVPTRDRVRIRFQSTELESKSGQFRVFSGILYACCIVDDEMTGLWKHKRNEKGITINGQLTLKRTPELEKDPPSADSPFLPRLNLYRWKGTFTR